MAVRSVLAPAALSMSLFAGGALAQSTFGTGCAGASGVTPTLAAAGTVKSGSTWTLEVTAPGGLGLGYLAIGFSNTTASVFGGATLPLDLGVLFGDPLWSGCALNVDPSYAIQPYLFDPSANGGLASFVFPGFDFGAVYVQAINLDPDFATRIAGVSQGLAVRRTAPPGMVAIAPGSFQMGTQEPLSEAPYYSDAMSQPAHTVTITQPFWMAQHEVTQSRYEALMGSNPSSVVGADLPVDSVSWLDAVAYCAALTAQETLLGNVPAGYEYRLPTEAEWEYACRAGTTTEFNVGATLSCDQARFLYSFHTQSGCGSDGTLPVGIYPPNAWGLFDMHGNVTEWCLDSVRTYTTQSQVDPFFSVNHNRVARGGSFQSKSARSTSVHRFSSGWDLSGPWWGFRVVLGPIRQP